jgi:hypothetical protein
MAGLFTAITALEPTTKNNGAKRISSLFASEERAHDSWPIIDFIGFKVMMSYVKWPCLFDVVDRPLLIR